MIIRVTAFIDVETSDPEDSCTGLNLGLENALSNFPKGYGEIISADVDSYRALSPVEIKELGYDAD